MRSTTLTVHPEEPVMVMFRNNHEQQPAGGLAIADEAWPDDSLTGIDDDAFAQAIADGRKSDEFDRVTVAA